LRLLSSEKRSYCSTDGNADFFEKVSSAEILDLRVDYVSQETVIFGAGFHGSSFLIDNRDDSLRRFLGVRDLDERVLMTHRAFAGLTEVEVLQDR
jgi:hypothetical protein